MKSTTAMIAAQYRIQEWAEQIKACQNRPAGMRVEEWCSQNNMTKATYYYRLGRVRKACLDSMPDEIIQKAVVPVPAELLKEQRNISGTVKQEGLDITIRNYCIHVSENTSLELLSSVLEVISRTQ